VHFYNSQSLLSIVIHRPHWCCTEVIDWHFQKHYKYRCLYMYSH
jgi:hypothetical protein